MHSGQQRRERVLPRTFDSSIRRECWESQPSDILRDGAKSTHERTQPCACAGTRCPDGQEDRSRGGEIDNRGNAEDCGRATPGECLCREFAPSMRFVERGTTGRGSSERNQRVAEHDMPSLPNRPRVAETTTRHRTGRDQGSTSETSLATVCRAGRHCDKRLNTIIVVDEREGIKTAGNTAKFTKAYNGS